MPDGFDDSKLRVLQDRIAELGRGLKLELTGVAYVPGREAWQDPSLVATFILSEDALIERHEAVDDPGQVDIDQAFADMLETEADMEIQRSIQAAIDRSLERVQRDILEGDDAND